jgi:hypothetical protein
MFALDLFNTKYEKELHEGAVDNLEARRIDILNDRMDDLIRRASVPNNKEAREALMHEYNKVKAERDSYYKVNTFKTQDECMGYGTLGEEGIGQDVVNKTEKMARATPPTPAGKVASTVKNAAKWLAGKGGPGREGPTYEGKDDAWQTETPWKEIPKAKSGRPVDPRGEVTHLSDVARREAVLKAHAQKKNSKEVTESQQLHQGDPIVVTGPNEFEGATGEIYDFSPSGTFVIVDLYNHGKHSMHLSDVEYNQYADQQEEDDWYDEKVEEGFQDFNKVEPYAVCLAGKPVKQFDYYEDARRFHDNWKKKLYREGDKAKADKITLMPLNLDETVEDYAEIYSPEAIALGKKFCDHYNITDDGDIQLAVEIIDSYLNEFKATNTPVDLKKIKSGVADAFRQVYRGMGPGPTFRKKFQEKAVAEAGSPAQQAAIAIAMKKAGKKPKSVDEGAMSNVHAAMADVYHRLAPKIERHRDSFLAGQLYDELENIAELHGIEPEFKRMMAGARNRAHMDYDTNPGGFQNWFWYLPFAEEELSEEQDTSGVEQAIIRRIMVAHTDLLKQFGPEKVMQAAEEVAYNVGDVDEIGTSDVSAYVNQVRQILGA